MIRSPFRAAAAVGIMVLVGWTLQTWLHVTYFTVVALLLIWGQVASFFLPTRYVLSETGVHVRGVLTKKTKEWREFRSYYRDSEGILLSPFVGRSRLERFRGVSLVFHGNGEEVASFVERAMADREV
jgi:hypothetical protein